MIYKRHCILTFRQLARTSTSPDTLFDASERPWANTAHNIAFNVYYFLATVHACIVRSFAARSRRYAARMQRCACEQEQARLAISERKRSDALASAASPASAALALRQRCLALRAPRSNAKRRDAAAPAQRFRGRTLEDTAPAPRCSRNHRAAATQHHCCQPAAIAGCTVVHQLPMHKFKSFKCCEM